MSLNAEIQTVVMVAATVAAGSNGSSPTQSFYWNWQNIHHCNIKSTQIKSFSSQQFQLYQGGYYLILALDLLYINTKNKF